MKIKDLIIIALITVLFLGALTPLDTQHFQYELIRSVTSADTPLDLTSAGDFASKPSDAIPLKTTSGGAGHGGNIAEIVFMADVPGSFTYTIQAWRKGNGMARIIATSVATTGTQEVVVFPDGGSTAFNWVDQIAAPTTNWMTPATSSDETGSNNVASIFVDLNGYEFVRVEFTSFTTVTACKAYISYR